MRKIGVMAGDGIGPEIVEQGLRVLARVADIEGFTYELRYFPHSGSHYRNTGELLSEESIREIGALDALYQGALGDPAYPDGLMEREVSLRLQQRLDLSVGIRPGQLWASGLTPLKRYGRGDIDILLIRDTTEDCFVAPGGFVRRDSADEIAIGLLVYTRKTVERVLRFAFMKAQARRQHLALVTQANAVPAHTIWTRTMDEVMGDYPDVTVEMLYCDSGAMAFVSRPDTLDVVVSPYWIGGILADLLGGVIGGVGLVGGARINLETNFGLFESAHGSAPRYTGLDVVSPIAQIVALALMLEHLGEVRSSERIIRAIDDTFRTGAIKDVSTRGPQGTVAQADEILRALDHVP
jgi:3-isopropylmalate dehydrogenase